MRCTHCCWEGLRRLLGRCWAEGERREREAAEAAARTAGEHLERVAADAAAKDEEEHLTEEAAEADAESEEEQRATEAAEATAQAGEERLTQKAAHRVWDPGGPSTSARVPAWPPIKDFPNFSVGGAQSGEVSVHNSVGGPDWFEDDGSMVFELAEGDVDDHIEMLYRYVLPEDCESDGSDGPLVYNYGHIPSAAGMYTSTPTAPPESGLDAGIDSACGYESSQASGGFSRLGGDVRKACQYASHPIAGWISGSGGAFDESSRYDFSSRGLAGGYTHGVCTGRLGQRPRRPERHRPAVALATPAGSASGAEVDGPSEYESPPALGGSSRPGGDAREACEYASLPIAGWISGSGGAACESSKHDFSGEYELPLASGGSSRQGGDTALFPKRWAAAWEIVRCDLAESVLYRRRDRVMSMCLVRGMSLNADIERLRDRIVAAWASVGLGPGGAALQGAGPGPSRPALLHGGPLRGEAVGTAPAVGSARWAQQVQAQCLQEELASEARAAQGPEAARQEEKERRAAEKERYDRRWYAQYHAELLRSAPRAAEADDTCEYESPPVLGGSSRPGGDVRAACAYESPPAFRDPSSRGDEVREAGEYTSPPITPAEPESDAGVDDACEYESPPALGGSSRLRCDVREAGGCASLPLGGGESLTAALKWELHRGSFARGYVWEVPAELCEMFEASEVELRTRRLGWLANELAKADPGSSSLFYSARWVAAWNIVRGELTAAAAARAERSGAMAWAARESVCAEARSRQREAWSSVGLGWRPGRELYVRTAHSACVWRPCEGEAPAPRASFCDEAQSVVSPASVGSAIPRTCYRFGQIGTDAGGRELQKRSRGRRKHAHRRSPGGGGHADRTPCAGGQHAPQAVARMSAGAARGAEDEASAQTRSQRVCAGRHEAARPQQCAPNQCRLDTVEGGTVRRDGPRWASERDLSRSISWAVGFRTRLLRKRAARSSVGLMVNGVPGVPGSLRRGSSTSGGGLLLSARGVPPRAGATCGYRSRGGFSRERAGPTAWLEDGDLAKARSCLRPFCAAGWPWEPD